MWPQKHLDWRGATYLDIGALEVPFQVKLTKMPLINPRLAKSQSWSKSVQNNIFHVFILIGQELLTPCDELTN